MNQRPTQAVFDESATTALLDALAPVMPILEQLVAIWKQREAEPSKQEQQAPSSAFHGQQSSTDLQDSDHPRLPRVHQGRGRRENLTGFHENTLHKAQDRRRLDVFAGYEACQHLFTGKQWEAIDRYWNQGLTQAEIGKTLGLKHSAVSGRLTRAAAQKEEYDKALRKERAQHVRKMQEESWE